VLQAALDFLAKYFQRDGRTPCVFTNSATPLVKNRYRTLVDPLARGLGRHRYLAGPSLKDKTHQSEVVFRAPWSPCPGGASCFACLRRSWVSDFPTIVLLVGEVALLIAPNVSFVTWLRLNQLALRHRRPPEISNLESPTLSRKA